MKLEQKFNDFFFPFQILNNTWAWAAGRRVSLRIVAFRRGCLFSLPSFEQKDQKEAESYAANSIFQPCY